MATAFNFRAPDYAGIFNDRAKVLDDIRADPQFLADLKVYYRGNPAAFISDWGMTSDPRNVEVGLPANVPFILFKRQREWVEWVVESWRNRRPGVCPKSRESGVSWLAIALSCTLCLFNEGVAIGFGSRKQEYVDLIGSPKSLFWKARQFIANLPPEFQNGFDLTNDAPHMRLLFHKTGSSITGESGDNIGRGDRASIYFVDESAFLEHPEVTEGALSATTNCRIDISTANGIGNPFHRKVTTWDAERVFRFHWRDDPRKDEDWYQRQLVNLDPVTVAQEIDIDFAASVEGVLIPSAWVQASIDAHVKLGLPVEGLRHGALDVADEGKDLNAFAIGHGILIEAVDEWSGKGDDIYGTVQRAFGICDDRGLSEFRYDADGLGAGVRGDARVLNEHRGGKPLTVQTFRGSDAVFNPDGEDVKGRLNKDYFANRKAQAWFNLRRRFQMTFRAVTGAEGSEEIDLERVISIPSALPLLNKLTSELSQPTWSLTPTGKVKVDKAPDGVRSPNLADAIMMLYAVTERAPIRFAPEVMERVRGLSPRPNARGLYPGRGVASRRAGA
jgi:hypothetical protein